MIRIAPNYYSVPYIYPYASTQQAAHIPQTTSTSAPDKVGQKITTPALPANTMDISIPSMPKGVDPVEMSVHGRIQYLTPEQAKNTMNIDPINQSVDGEDAASAHEIMKKSECQTCKNRKYQDGSDDPGVSFKTATNLSPERAATAVRSHEMEHLHHERAKAHREDRKVVSQSVTIHTAICPECGTAYVSGGTTRTTTAKNKQPEYTQQTEAIGHILDTVA